MSMECLTVSESKEIVKKKRERDRDGGLSQGHTRAAGRSSHYPNLGVFAFQ